MEVTELQHRTMLGWLRSFILCDSSVNAWSGNTALPNRIFLLCKWEIYSLAVHHTCNNILHFKAMAVLWAITFGSFEELTGWCQLILCLIVLLILARLSSEIRYVRAATKLFATKIRLTASPRKPLIVLLQWGDSAYSPDCVALHCWCCVYDNLSTRQSVHFLAF